MDNVHDAVPMEVTGDRRPDVVDTLQLKQTNDQLQAKEQAFLEDGIGNSLALVNDVSCRFTQDFLLGSCKPLEELLPNPLALSDTIKKTVTDMHEELTGSEDLIAQFCQSLVDVARPFKEGKTDLTGAFLAMQQSCKHQLIVLPETAVQELGTMEKQMGKLASTLETMEMDFKKMTRGHTGSKAKALVVNIAGLDQRQRLDREEALQTQSDLRNCRLIVVKLKKLIELKNIDLQELEVCAAGNSEEIQRQQAIVKGLRAESEEVNKAARSQSAEALKGCVANALEQQRTRASQAQQVHDARISDLQKHGDKKRSCFSEVANSEAEEPGFESCHVYAVADKTRGPWLRPGQGQRQALDQWRDFSEALSSGLSMENPDAGAKLQAHLTTFDRRNKESVSMTGGTLDVVDKKLQEAWKDDVEYLPRFFKSGKITFMKAITECAKNIKKFAQNEKRRSRTHIVLFVCSSWDLDKCHLPDLVNVCRDLSETMAQVGWTLSGVVQQMSGVRDLMQNYGKLAAALNGGRDMFESCQLNLTADCPPAILKRLAAELGKRKSLVVLASAAEAQRAEAAVLEQRLQEEDAVHERQLEALKSIAVEADRDLTEKCKITRGVLENQIRKAETSQEQHRELRDRTLQQVRALSTEIAALEADRKQNLDSLKKLEEKERSQDIVREPERKKQHCDREPTLGHAIGERRTDDLVEAARRYREDTRGLNLMILNVISSAIHACHCVGHRIRQILARVNAAGDVETPDQKVALTMDAYSKQLDLVRDSATVMHDWRKIVAFCCEGCAQELVEEFSNIYLLEDFLSGQPQGAMPALVERLRKHVIAEEGEDGLEDTIKAIEDDIDELKGEKKAAEKDGKGDRAQKKQENIDKKTARMEELREKQMKKREERLTKSKTYGSLDKMLKSVDKHIYGTWRSVSLSRNVKVFMGQYAQLIKLYMDFVDPFLKKVEGFQRETMNGRRGHLGRKF